MISVFRKKLVSLLLSLVLVLVVMPLAANATNVMVGDVNADSRVNIGDVARLYAHFQGNALVGQASMIRADLNDAGWLYPSYVQKLYERTRHFTIQDLVTAVYQLPENTPLSDTATLSGRVVTVNDGYHPDYNNISVTIKVDGLEETILCYRMTGDRVQGISVNDQIVVTGQLRHYKGQVEFASGCIGKIDMVWLSTDDMHKRLVDLVYDLPVNVAARTRGKLVGKVVAVEQMAADATAITVTIYAPGCSDKPVVCRNMLGDKIHRVRLGDVLYVEGTLQNYNGTVEFAPGCVLEGFDTVIQHQW